MKKTMLEMTIWQNYWSQSFEMPGSSGWRRDHKKGNGVCSCSYSIKGPSVFIWRIILQVQWNESSLAKYSNSPLCLPLSALIIPQLNDSIWFFFPSVSTRAASWSMSSVILLHVLEWERTNFTSSINRQEHPQNGINGHTWKFCSEASMSFPWECSVSALPYSWISSRHLREGYVPATRLEPEKFQVNQMRMRKCVKKNNRISKWFPCFFFLTRMFLLLLLLFYLCAL